MLPLYPQASELCGHSLKIIAALILRSPNGWEGQVEIDDLRSPARISPARVTECLDRLVEAGVLRYTYCLGVITYRLRRSRVAVDVPREHLKALLVLGPSDVKLFFAILSFCNPADGLAWPGIARLSATLGRCRRTIERGVRALRELGLLVVNKVHWTKIPRFRWPLRTRPARKRITVYARPQRPPSTRTVSLSAAESCRWVREHIQKELCLAGARKRIIVDVDSLPEDLRGIAQDGDLGGDFSRRKTLEAVGMTPRQAGWVCGRFPRISIDMALRTLNARWGGVRHRVRYVMGILRRVQTC